MAREKADNPAVTGKALFEQIKNRHENAHKEICYMDEPLDALDAAQTMLDGGKNLFVTMGAGDNWKLGYALYERLRNEE